MSRDKLSNYMLDFFPLMMRKFFKGMKNKKNAADGVTHKILYNLLKDNGKPMKYYSELLSISKPNFTKATNILIEDDLVKRVKDDSDRRIVKLVITEKGKEVIDQRTEKLRNIFLEKIKDLSDDDINTLCENFESITSILDKITD